MGISFKLIYSSTFRATSVLPRGKKWTSGDNNGKIARSPQKGAGGGRETKVQFAVALAIFGKGLLVTTVASQCQ